MTAQSQVVSQIPPPMGKENRGGIDKEEELRKLEEEEEMNKKIMACSTTTTSPEVTQPTKLQVQIQDGSAGDFNGGGVVGSNVHGGNNNNNNAATTAKQEPDEEEDTTFTTTTTSSASGLNANANENDPDCSYVFVSQKDSPNGGDSSDWDLNVEKEEEEDDITVQEEVEEEAEEDLQLVLSDGEELYDRVPGGEEIVSSKDHSNHIASYIKRVAVPDNSHVQPLNHDVANEGQTAIANASTTDVPSEDKQEQPPSHSEATTIEEEVQQQAAADEHVSVPALLLVKEIQESSSSPHSAEIPLPKLLPEAEESVMDVVSETTTTTTTHEQTCPPESSNSELKEVKVLHDSQMLVPHGNDAAVTDPPRYDDDKSVEQNHLDDDKLSLSSNDEVNSSEVVESSADHLGRSSQEESSSQVPVVPEVEGVEQGVSLAKMESPPEVKDIPTNAQTQTPESAAPASDSSCQLVEQEEEKKTHVDEERTLKEHNDFQHPLDDNRNTNLNQAADLSSEPNLSLEPENDYQHALVADNEHSSFPTSKSEDGKASLTNAPVCPIISATLQNGSSESNNSFPSPNNLGGPETKDGIEPVKSNLLCPVVTAGEFEIEATTGLDEVNEEISESYEITSESDIALINYVEESKATDSSCTTVVNSEAEVSNMCPPLLANGVDIISCNDAITSPSQVQFGSFAPGLYPVSGCSRNDSDNCTRKELKDFEQQVHKNEVSNPSPDGFIVDPAVEKNETLDSVVHKDEVSTPSPEGFSADPGVEKNATPDSVKRPFHFLIRIPKFDDSELKEQIEQSDLLLKEKQNLRDDIKSKIRMVQEICNQICSDYEAATSEERAARRLVRLKRQEIDSVHSVINRVKNAISVEDIDVRINHMEHMIQHETLPLKEEKQFIREIKQLKHHREQLSSNMGSQDEVQQAMEQRDQIEERLKILKKELDLLKGKVSTAVAVAESARKRKVDESIRLRELYAQHKAANEVRQEAYRNLQNLKHQAYVKVSQFRMLNKGGLVASNECASSRDKETVHRLCLNQVEKIMELWNKDDDFRENYIRCNIKSTLRRFRTLDGRALGPDEESCVLVSVVDAAIMDRSGFKLGQVNPPEVMLISDLEKERPLTSTEAAKKTEVKSMERVAEPADEPEKNISPGKPTMGTTTLSSLNSREETGVLLEDEHKQTKDEEEVARKEEQSRKKEEEVKLKEQRRLEEIAKAKEALERKRKIAEKAQFRAEVRAQKEAEQKEKEKERRAKRKERKKAGPGGHSENNNFEEGDVIATAAASEFISVATMKKEPEVNKEGRLTTAMATTSVVVNKRPQKAFTKQQSKTKSCIPPPLRNKNKRRMQQWIWIIVSAVLVIALILLGSTGFYSDLGRKQHLRNPTAAGF